MDSNQPSSAHGFSALDSNTTLNGGYVIDSLQGQGRFGLVYLAKRLSDDLSVAIKEISIDFINEKSSIDEISVALEKAKTLKHRSIIKTIDFFILNERLYVVMEWIDGDSLENAIRYQALSSAKKHWFVQQLIDAIGYASEQGVFHGAVSLENVMIDKFGRAVIADFGLNALEPNEVTPNNISGLVYFPPEKIKQRLSCQDHDWYSLGVVIYALFNNRMPFKLSSLNGLYESKLQLRLVKKYNKAVHLTPLIKGLLNANYKQRLKSKDAVQEVFDKALGSSLEIIKAHAQRTLIVTISLVIAVAISSQFI